MNREERIPMTKAIDDILAERERQIKVEGFDATHDDGHIHEELILAAICYARYTKFTKIGYIKRAWPWDIAWWKPKDRRTNLVKAAALLIAEIQRIDRENENTDRNERTNHVT